MKSLKESLLSDIDNSLKQGDKDIKNYDCWGRVFKLKKTMFDPSSTNVFSLDSLKELTKNMKFINDNTEMIEKHSVAVASVDKKGKMFANWVDHLNLNDLNLTYSDLKKLSSKSSKITDEIINKIIINLTELCKQNDIFKLSKPVHINISYVRGPNEQNDLELIIWHHKKVSNIRVIKNTIKFVYEINI